MDGLIAFIGPKENPKPPIRNKLGNLEPSLCSVAINQMGVVA